MLRAMPGGDLQGLDWSGPTIDELVLADDPVRWAALGFGVLDGCCQLGKVRLRLVGREDGRVIVGWSLRGIAGVEFDGLPTVRSESPVPPAAPAHPNGVVAIDHVVAMSPALDRTDPAGAPRQAFFRLGGEILEVVQVPDDAVERGGGRDRPARLWGLALTVEDLDRTVARLGEHVGSIRPAVQPGRRIATLRRSAGLAVPVALMTVGEAGAV
jgi:hypothetical protein